MRKNAITTKVNQSCVKYTHLLSSFIKWRNLVKMSGKCQFYLSIYSVNTA